MAFRWFSYVPGASGVCVSAPVVVVDAHAAGCCCCTGPAAAAVLPVAAQHWLGNRTVETELHLLLLLLLPWGLCFAALLE